MSFDGVSRSGANTSACSCWCFLRRRLSKCLRTDAGVVPHDRLYQQLVSEEGNPQGRTAAVTALMSYLRLFNESSPRKYTIHRIYIYIHTYEQYIYKLYKLYAYHPMKFPFWSMSHISIDIPDNSGPGRDRQHRVVDPWGNLGWSFNGKIPGKIKRRKPMENHGFYKQIW